MKFEFITFRKINGFEAIANLEEKLGNIEQMVAFQSFQCKIHFQRKALQMGVQKMDLKPYLTHQF